MKKLAVIASLVLLIALPIIAQETPPSEAVESKKPEKVTVLFGVVPKGLKVNVFHGKTLLGETPFEHEFDRNSGPVDIVFKRPDYFNVNTRVFTYEDSKLIVKMTKRSNASQLYGYKEEIPPDAGVPPADDISSPSDASVPSDAPIAPPTTPSPSTTRTP